MPKAEIDHPEGPWIATTGVASMLVLVLLVGGIAFVGGVVRGKILGASDESRSRSPQSPFSVDAQAALPSDDVRFVAVDVDGTTWFRVARGHGQPDRVARRNEGGDLEWFENLETAVRLGYGRILRHGTLPDFWAVDDRDNVWIGPEYYDGSDWNSLPLPDRWSISRTRFDDRAIVDRNGRAWVPYRSVRDCLALDPCTTYGMAALDLRGDVLDDLVVEYPPELEALGVPWISFEQTGTEIVAVSPKAAYKIPTLERRPFPELAADPDTGERRAGFASTTAILPNGQLSVFLWLDATSQQVAREARELQWTGWEWQSVTLNRGPLFESDKATFVTAATYDRSGMLWLASSRSEIAARSGADWPHHLTPSNSPLGGVIHDMEIDLDGNLWLATQLGAKNYDPDSRRWETSGALYLPMLSH